MFNPPSGCLYFKRNTNNLNYSPTGRMLWEDPAVRRGVVVVKEQGWEKRSLSDFSHLDFRERKSGGLEK